MLNEDLELTPQQEIKRLKRVILEKDAAIKAFKEYDKRRTEEYNKMVEDCNMMQLQFDQFCEDVRDFEEIDERTADDFIKFFNRYYQRLKVLDQTKQLIGEVRNRLNTLEEFADRLETDAKKFKADIRRFKESIEIKQKEWKKK